MAIPVSNLLLPFSFGDAPIEKFLDSLSEKQQVKVLRMFSTLPHMDCLHTSSYEEIDRVRLWEIRVLGKDNVRVIYAVVMENGVLILSGFMKRSAKNALHELPNCVKAI